MNEWPDARAFRENWPLLAEELLIAQWKIERALAMIDMPEPVLHERIMARPVRRGQQPPYVLEIAQEIDIDLLYPPKPEQRDWRDTYRAELSAHPELAADLPMDGEDDQGDGIELVLDRAQLRDNERWVVRDYLYGKSIELISEDSGVKPQTLQTLLYNGIARLKWLGDTTGGGPQRKRGVLINKGTLRRARRRHVSDPVDAGEATHRAPSGRGSGPVGSPQMRRQATQANAQRFSAAQLDVHGNEASEHRFMAALG